MSATYEPKVGDLVVWGGDVYVVESLECPEHNGHGPCVYVGCLGYRGKRYVAAVKYITPRRPTEVGQRVRWGERLGTVIGSGIIGTSACVALDDFAPYMSFCRVDALVRIADEPKAAPWVPKVGERVRVRAGFQGAGGEFVVRRVVSRGVHGWDAGPDAECEDMLRADCALEPVAADKPAPVLSDAEAASASRTVDEVRVSTGRDESPTTGPTCQHCGSAVYRGLFDATCPKGCDLTLRAAEPEPTTVVARWSKGGRSASTFTDWSEGDERVFVAGGIAPSGEFVATRHPTREGAIAAWRKAVRS